MITHIPGFPVADLIDWSSKSGEILLDPGTYTFVYDYPLIEPVEIKHKIKKKCGVLTILLLAAQDYSRFYEEIDNTRGLCIYDLRFESVSLLKSKKITFSIGSY